MDSKQRPPISVNYLYFGGFFILLVLLLISSVFIKENLGGSRIFFSLYALGQIILETSFLILCGWIIQQFLGSACFAIFIGGTFFLLVFHVIDFLMDRILDLSIWETLSFVFDESFGNFINLLDASGLSLWLWLAMFVGIAALPLLGIFIYKATDLIAQRNPLRLRQEWLLQAFVCIPAALFLWDFSASKVIHPDAYTAFIKSLPWKYTFLQPENVQIVLNAPIRDPLSEKIVANEIEQTRLTPTQKPNIYLFVIESLREDCITSQVAPHLHQFKNENTHFDLALSNANCSATSWFSIFHSQFPYFWKRLQNDDWQMGSPALKLLKKWGYKIRLYSSAHLGYYGMEELLFGKDQYLLDSYQKFHHKPPVQASETDAEAIDQIQKDIGGNSELEQGQLFIVFLDSTHFDYSWPKTMTPKFTPFAKESAYFKAFYSDKHIERIKNRYRNAVYYVDSLFGKFLERLPRKEEAVVIVTGDHGEEFFEHGHLFHCSHLAHQQIHIPLYMKFGRQERKVHQRPVTTQMDIFPSLLDYLSGSSVSFLEGQSIFQEMTWPYAVTARFNASRSPYEFCLHNGKHKLIAQFSNRKNIFEGSSLQILSLCECKNQKAVHCKNGVEKWVQNEFGEALKRLFKKSATDPEGSSKEL